jgi:hypothetical protein
VNMRWQIPFRANKISNVHVVFRNFCETSCKSQLIDEFGTWQYIKQRGRSNFTQHQLVLTALEQRAHRYQKNQSNGELEDEQLLDGAINETGMIAAPPVEDNGEQRRTAEQEICKETRKVSKYLFDVHGLPPGWKGEGVTRVIYENLNCLQSTLSKNDKCYKPIIHCTVQWYFWCSRLRSDALRVIEPDH